MTVNYVLLETIELNASAASVTFDNIPQTGYTDLKIVVSGRTDNTSPNILFSINGSTSTFTSIALYGDGASAASTSAVPRVVSYASMSTDTANTFGNTEIYIPNYTGSTNKSYSVDTVSENNATTAYTGLFAGLWSTTSAITYLTFTPSTGNFVANSTFSLYGTAAFGTTPTFGPKATGGNIVANDGTYWYHAFLTSGTFTPARSLSCDVMLVAGGGGGLWGGGGAGGFRVLTSQSLVNGTNYTTIVGAGGTQNNVFGGVSGNDSSFSGSNFTTIASTGGGGGGSTGTTSGKAGGSGGGGGNDGAFAGGSGNLGAYSPAEGFAGGTGSSSGGAGGGGATAAGGSYSGGANGGAGNSSYSSWGLATSTGQNISGTYWYAGGGGGGNPGSSGGNGGGGAGNPSTPTSGTRGTGGGGGGGWNVAGKEGGSGIVIIRYAMA
jgi:hypothetical protein